MSPFVLNVKDVQALWVTLHISEIQPRQPAVTHDNL